MDSMEFIFALYILNIELFLRYVALIALLKSKLKIFLVSKAYEQFFFPYNIIRCLLFVYLILITVKSRQL